MAFDDGVGEVSGTWVNGRTPYEGSRMLVYIMVEDMERTLALIAENGGTVTEGVGAHASEITAMFRDPSGNVFGVFQERWGKGDSRTHEVSPLRALDGDTDAYPALTRRADVWRASGA